jgi:hypothetical protein
MFQIWLHPWRPPSFVVLMKGTLMMERRTRRY